MLDAGNRPQRSPPASAGRAGPRSGPTRSSIPKNSPIRGRRRSHGDEHHPLARLGEHDAEVGQGGGLALARPPGWSTIRLRSCRSCRANCSEVRSDRYDSAAGEVGSADRDHHRPAAVARRSPPGSWPAPGYRWRVSVASLEASRSSRLSRRKAAARPSASPAARPSRASWTGLGELGETGACAGVTSTTSLVVDRAADLHLGQLFLQHGLLVEQRDATCEVVSALKGLSLLAERGDLRRSWPRAAVRLRSSPPPAVLPRTRWRRGWR